MAGNLSSSSSNSSSSDLDTEVVQQRRYSFLTKIVLSCSSHNLVLCSTDEEDMVMTRWNHGSFLQSQFSIADAITAKISKIRGQVRRDAAKTYTKLETSWQR
jgi:hypothetical protein